jgi:hypothetical protein
MILLQSGLAHVPVFVLWGIIIVFSIVVFTIPAVWLRGKIHDLSNGNKLLKIGLYFLTYVLSNMVVVGIIWFNER